MGGPAAFICGLAGRELGRSEARFLAEARPCGIIIFTRNFETDEQLRRLIEDARAAIGAGDTLVLVDQEGGRVQRLRGGDWPDMPAAARFGARHAHDAEAAREAARLAAQGLGQRLRAVGINTNCAPCLDVPAAGADKVIGDRAYGTDPAVVADLGRATAEGYLAAGVVPVIKHIPGHGRAAVDSHKALPVVGAGRTALEAVDFEPFRALSDMPAAMSAHVTFEAFDSAQPASTSLHVTAKVIRGHCAFDGLLMSDDISMGALSGGIGARAAAVLAAGSDVVLHCNGNLDEMMVVAANVPRLEALSLARYDRCIEIAGRAPQTIADARFQWALREVVDHG